MAVSNSLDSQASSTPAPQPAPQSPPQSLPRPEKVPDKLLNELHEANERFSQARHHREEAIDSASPETAPRDRAQQELLDAEKKVEEVTEEIDRDLHQA